MKTNNDNKKIIIRKVPLKQFMNMLHEIYRSGADFVDLHGFKNEEAKQDEITIGVPLEYMMPPEQIESVQLEQSIEDKQMEENIMYPDVIKMSGADLKDVLEDV